MVTPTSTSWLQRLIQVGLREDSLHGLNSVMAVLGRAAGASAALLWEQTEDLDGKAVPSVLAHWPGDGDPSAASYPAECDPTTMTAFRTRTLALPQAVRPDRRGRGASERTIAALPVDYVDGYPGVLSLVGADELGEEAFDVVVDLLHVLPELCRTIRERQTLALVRGCNDILHRADLESPNHPLSRSRVADHLAEVCRLMAGALQCNDVSLYLHDGSTSDESFPLFASSSDSPPGPPVVRRGQGWAGLSIEERLPWAVPHGGANGGTPDDHRRGVTPEGRKLLMVVPLLSGNHAWGVIRCSETYLPPLHFTQSDFALLEPAAQQLAQFWSNWLHRRIISAENKSWRRLAAGITAFNKLLSDELSQHPSRDRPVYDAAISVVRDVVSECTSSEVLRAGQKSPEGVSLILAAEAGEALTSGLDGAAAGAGQEGRTIAAAVYASRRQQWAVLNRDDPREAQGWLISTPIRVGNKAYGTLNAAGNTASLPLNSLQVCEIVADQLGLYQHLQHTLLRLGDTRHQLEQTLHGQAEALEDLEHQLVSPLLTATNRTERVLQSGRFDSRTESQLRAVRGLCRKASRVAMSAGVFAALSKGRSPAPKDDLLSSDDILRLLIAAADDAQHLSNPRQRIQFNVERASIRALGRRLVRGDLSFLEQCVGNLLDNAAKYSYSETVVDIRGLTSDNSLAIEVTNIGLPMGPEDVARCLERNWRGESARNSTGEGSGLGLWIAASLMKSIRGAVRVRAEDEQTTVTLVLPLA